MERYTTNMEIEFINGLGTFSIHGSRIGKANCLKLYLQAIPLRKDWADLDKAIIIKVAEAESSRYL